MGENTRAKVWTRNLEETKAYYTAHFNLRSDEIDDILLRLKHGENMYDLGAMYMPQGTESQGYTFIHNFKARFGKFMEFPKRQKYRRLLQPNIAKPKPHAISDIDLSASSEIDSHSYVRVPNIKSNSVDALVIALNNQGRLQMIEELEEYLKNLKKKLSV